MRHPEREELLHDHCLILNRVQHTDGCRNRHHRNQGFLVMSGIYDAQYGPTTEQ
ncbi:hypothetical protein [Streptomyces sp. ML-6]|uniref:hypothetical protein n=1 Tax=Streptomyces sp. ML-6 TaxID=2982693 RepID=UPI0024BFD0F5|nr:hypothetical protein [Streptomyces sp. ML-6]MDK0524077.1 hypothetical protein [Streptomyces sp. ML-6]